MTHRLRRAILACLLPTIVALSANAVAEDWPQFRGPGGEGHSSERGLPLEWSETEHIAWKTPVPGRGWSSPSIVGDQIWLTTATDEGRSLRALRLNRQTGAIERDVEVFRLDDPGEIHSKNSHASPTPIVAKGRVYVHFGAHGTACLNDLGKVLWRNQELKYNHRHGPGGSPVLFEDLLMFSCDGTDVAFVVALDIKTGKVRWKQDRDGPMAYSTPLVIRAAGRDQVVSTGGGQVVAYDPASGTHLWNCRYDGYSLIPRPVYGHGLVFICTGFNSPQVYAVRPDGNGDVTDSHVAWTLERGAPHSPSPLLVGSELYLVSDDGVATCLDAESGELHWQERLGGNHSASPIYADGRIYFLDERGLTTVIAPGTTFEKLAENQLDGETLASIGVSQGALFLRTDTHLYCIK